MTAVAYRNYDLPWTPSPEDERRVRRVLGAALGLFIGLGIVIPLMPERERSQVVAPAVPERVVEFLLERPKPPPPPEPKVELPRPQPKPEVLQRVERPKPVPAPVAEAPPRPDPRKKAAASGLLALSDQLAELRDLDVEQAPAQTLNKGAGEKTRVDRALLTSRTGEGSGGIAVSKVSSSFGGGSTALAGHATAKVASSVAAAPASDVQRTGRSSQASRTREEVELVFDRNKSAIYALYARALRDNPALQGKVVLEVTIAPSGEVTDCRVVSSDLGDAELERKLVSRVRMFRFEARDVAPMTTTKPIEFFPA
ncbi:MAG TPA: TonB family protein [Myxococcota bacterium]|nr:TonB family protein [Myxococcota bacterium]